MANNRKTVESRIAELEEKKVKMQAKIETFKTKISGFDAKIQDLKNKQKEKELENLLKIIKASGKTPEEVLDAIKTEKR